MDEAKRPTEEQSGAPPRRTARLVLPLFVLAAGIWMRWTIAGESLWLDELHSAWAALGPFGDTAERAAEGNQGPLFFWVLQLWTEFAGDGTRALRAPSLVAGGLLLVAMFVAVRRWTSTSIAAVTCLALAAIDKRLLFYSTELRPYACVQLLGLVHMMLLLEVIRRPTRVRRVGLVLLGAAVFHLHYTAALLFAAEVVVLLFAKSLGRGRAQLNPATPTAGDRFPVDYSWWRIAVDAACLALLLAPSAWQVLDIGERRQMWSEMTRSLEPAVFWLELRGKQYLLLPLVAFTLEWFRAPGMQLAERRCSPQIWIGCWALALVPLAAAWLATATELAPLYFPRYYTVAFAGPILIAGLTVARYRQPFVRLSLASALILMSAYPLATSWQRTGRLLTDRREDWRGAIAWLREEGDRSRPVIVHSGLLEARRKLAEGARGEIYCLFPVTAAYPLTNSQMAAIDGRLSTSPSAAAATRRAAEASGAYLIVRGGKRSGDTIAAHLANDLGSAMRPKRKPFGPSLGVYAIELPDKR
ncbi:MAG: glycosyltransferase family 39 protein [Pirellulaceae bacterium]|nr:glycosyltransferase family 39 protein [Pirellulaceae bacterium]